MNSGKNPQGLQISKKKQYYKRRETLEDKILHEAARKSSQYHSTLYDRMEADGRLETFLKLVATASAMELNRKDATAYINEYMGDYFRGKFGLSASTFGRLVERYPDIAEAWTTHRNTVAGSAVRRISELIAKETNLETLLKIAKAFDNIGIVHDSDRSTYTPTRRTIIVQEGTSGNVGNAGDSQQYSPESLETIQQIAAEYRKQNAQSQGLNLQDLRDTLEIENNEVDEISPEEIEGDNHPGDVENTEEIPEISIEEIEQAEEFDDLDIEEN